MHGVYSCLYHQSNRHAGCGEVSRGVLVAGVGSYKKVTGLVSSENTLGLHRDS